MKHDVSTIQDMYNDMVLIKPDPKKNSKTETGIIVDTDDNKSYKTGMVLKQTKTSDKLTNNIENFSVAYQARNIIEVLDLDGNKLDCVPAENILFTY